MEANDLRLLLEMHVNLLKRLNALQAALIRTGVITDAAFARGMAEVNATIAVSGVPDMTRDELVAELRRLTWGGDGNARGGTRT
jgi:hypothetical protein